jgi:predicted MPP superfamily phosphohydrolase
LSPRVARRARYDAGLVHQKLRQGFRIRRFAGPGVHVDAIEHLRVAHLTDLHVGRVTPAAVQELAVELTNSLRPDLVAITGDFVCHSQLYLDQLSWLVGRFDAPVVCVLGNHDYWAGADEVRWALRRGGAEVLDNQHTVITLRRQRLQIVGLDDAYTGHASRDDALRGLDPRLPTLGLSHIAEEADALWAHGVPLVLSGHTHAGQVTLARLHELAIGRLAGHKYVHGLYGARTHGGAWPGAVYVGAGIGASVMPLRVGERGRREIALFELGHAPGSFDEPLPEQRPGQGRVPTPKKRYLRAAAVVKKERRRQARAR